jgi:hypothetical protein
MLRDFSRFLGSGLGSLRFAIAWPLILIDVEVDAKSSAMNYRVPHAPASDWIVSESLVWYVNAYDSTLEERRAARDFLTRLAAK